MESSELAEVSAAWAEGFAALPEELLVFAEDLAESLVPEVLVDEELLPERFEHEDLDHEVWLLDQLSVLVAVEQLDAFHLTEVYSGECLTEVSASWLLAAGKLESSELTEV